MGRILLPFCPEALTSSGINACCKDRKPPYEIPEVEMDQIVLSKQQEDQLKDQGGRYTDE